MQGIKEFNKKIISLKNTKKITKTMKMVAASKFRRVYKTQASARLYAGTLTEMMSRIAASVEGAAHPLLKARLPVRRILIVVMTSDRGLCGGFNNNLIRFIREWLKVNQKTVATAALSFCGKKGFQALHKSGKVEKFYEQITQRPQFSDAQKVAQDLNAAFLAGGYDEVYLAYNLFKSAMSQTPVLEKLLPIDPQVLTKVPASKTISDYIFEPAQEELLNRLVPRYVQYRIYDALLENAAGEHGARMTAMDNAFRNCSDLMDRYLLLRNRARQASITRELIEIISGAEALK